MVIVGLQEYYDKYELADLLHVTAREIQNWEWDGVLGKPLLFRDGLSRWNREEVERIIGHKIPDDAEDFYGWERHKAANEPFYEVEPSGIHSTVYSFRDDI